MLSVVQRRLPVGAEPAGGGVHFRVWAPRRKQVEVAMDGSTVIPLEREPNGYFSGVVDAAKAGMHYRFRLDHGDLLVPDPASRFQPEGPHGPSEIVDPSQYRWNDAGWPGVRIEGQVIYEMHIGTFTQEGTWSAAREILPELAETGITLLEIMPVAEFPGRFGWGYDGVDLFAPTRLYGTPDDFRRFVDRAHSVGLGVILDVVYNHVGPDGNYLKQYSDDYFTTRHENEWGEAVNFDGTNSEPVREFFVANACYWIAEFHLDGLRLDATQQIFDNSPAHILSDISRETRRTAGQRTIVLIAENERQRACMVRKTGKDGYGLDAIWNDDFHHAACVALTGHTEAYYSDYAGTPQELISATKWGFLYQGQYYTWQKQPRGTYALDLEAPAFVTFIENHDQLANSAYGTRMHDSTTLGRYKAITTLLLLGPGTPMLFQGQEYGASTPFLYFADHYPELAARVEKGRAEFLSQFPSITHGNTAFALGVPQDRATFERCKLNREERRLKSHALALFRDLLALRREDPIFSAQRSDWIHGAVLGPEAFALRFMGGKDGERLILINLGRTLTLRPNPEPLLAPPRTGEWEMMWCSDDPKYRGPGCPTLPAPGTWTLPGHSAVVMGCSECKRDIAQQQGGI
jgi:maltooligosyltrehalose trehalohydrolase